MTLEERMQAIQKEAERRIALEESRTVKSIRDIPLDALRKADWVVKKPEKEKAG